MSKNLIYVDFHYPDELSSRSKHYVAIEEMQSNNRKCWAITGCESNWGCVIPIDGKYAASFQDAYLCLDDVFKTEYIHQIYYTNFLDAINRLLTTESKNSPESKIKIKFYNPYKLKAEIDGFWAVDLIDDKFKIPTALP